MTLDLFTKHKNLDEEELHYKFRILRDDPLLKKKEILLLNGQMGLKIETIKL